MLITSAEILALFPNSGVTDDEVTGAHYVIETYVDVNITDTTSENFSVKDLRCLRNAVMFQAIFMTTNPGLFQTSSVQSQQQDNVIVDAMFASNLILAPLSERSIKNLSWKKGSRRNRPGMGRKPNFFTDELDNWSPLNL